MFFFLLFCFFLFAWCQDPSELQVHTSRRIDTNRVLLGDSYSTTQTINAGFPQGSILGSLLALMYEYLDELSK